MMRVIFDWRFRPKNPRKLSALTFKTIPGILIMQGTCSWAWKDLIALENLGIITVNRCHGRSHQSKQSGQTAAATPSAASASLARTNLLSLAPSSGHSRQRLKCAFFLQSFLQIFHSLKGSAISGAAFFTREVVRLFLYWLHLIQVSLGQSLEMLQYER